MNHSVVITGQGARGLLHSLGMAFIQRDIFPDLLHCKWVGCGTVQNHMVLDCDNEVVDLLLTNWEKNAGSSIGSRNLKRKRSCHALNTTITFEATTQRPTGPLLLHLVVLPHQLRIDPIVLSLSPRMGDTVSVWLLILPEKSRSRELVTALEATDGIRKVKICPHEEVLSAHEARIGLFWTSASGTPDLSTRCVGGSTCLRWRVVRPALADATNVTNVV